MIFLALRKRKVLVEYFSLISSANSSPYELFAIYSNLPPLFSISLAVAFPIAKHG